ncbi:protein of unknown function [Candidatus Nitrosacidococcus tergens]|uniref:Uncharacterized protein n=1 Tax=Candidatus Nitrosacidococcus tergens TaxID=553981 RepID=A0A7G1QBM2_9GAMM|nr:protein of unknown function [Candidatus Nitrosacidococcus tergens]
MILTAFLGLQYQFEAVEYADYSEVTADHSYFSKFILCLHRIVIL